MNGLHVTQTHETRWIDHPALGRIKITKEREPEAEPGITIFGIPIENFIAAEHEPEPEPEADENPQILECRDCHGTRFTLEEYGNYTRIANARIFPDGRVTDRDNTQLDKDGDDGWMCEACGMYAHEYLADYLFQNT